MTRKETLGSLNLEANEFMQTEGAEETALRFSEGFSGFMTSRKQQAVLELLREEFPDRVNDADFVARVVARLDETVLEEQPYVFLSMNPNYKK